jgi:outer membrane protein, heavy metal efflux system
MKFSPGFARLAVRATLTCVSLGSLNTMAAQEDQNHSAINLKWALEQTLQQNPELQAYPYEIRGAEALQLQASVRPTPTLAVEIENVAGSGDFNGTDSADYTLTLSQVIELGSKRQRRVNVASADQRRLQNEYELARLDVLAETSRRFYGLLQLQILQQTLDERIQLEQNALKVIQQRARAGAVGDADASKMALRLAQSQAMHAQTRADITQAKSSLAIMWLSPGAFDQANGSLMQLPALPSQETLLAKLEQSAAFMQQTAMQRLADARVQLAQANGRSNLELGLGVRQLEASNDQALVFSMSMPLAFSNPNRGRIANAHAQRELTYSQTRLQQRQLELTLLQVQQKLNDQWQHAQRLQQQLLPKAQQLLSDTERGYQRGRYSVLQWTDAQAELFALKRQQIETHTQIFMQLLELERITGQPMSKAAGESL